MFGYVRVSKPQLRVREYEFYRASYCGLCRAMGKCTGQCSRMTLSYDFAFLALLRVALTGDEVKFESKRCIAHPLKKRSCMKRNSTLEYCAGAAALLNYHKVRDDLSDEHGFKKMRAVVLLPFMAYSRKRAIKKLKLSELDGRISEGLSRLAETEAARHPSVDEPAGVFGEILGDIIAFGLSGDRNRVAKAFGVSVGKWIYVADALDDWAEDAKKGRYNPFILLYGKALPDESELEGIRIALKNELCSAESAFDLIEFENDDIKNIVMNILYLGMPDRIDSISADIGKNGKNKTAERIDNK